MAPLQLSFANRDTIAGRRLVARTGGWLRMANSQPLVRRIMHVTNFDRLIPVHTDTGDDAEG